jgi:hypothetical protein
MIIEILDNLIGRLNNMFTVQTQEVIPELNKIKELLEQKPQEKPVVIVEEKEINNEPVEEVKQESTEVISSEKTIEELRKEYTDKFGKKPFA